MNAEGVIKLIFNRFFIQTQYQYHTMSRLEFVYAFANESMPGLFKIGETHSSDTPLKRLGEANLPDTYRPPTFYTLAFAIKVPDSKKAEKYIHTLLENTRVNMNREFFRISLDDVTNIINNNMHIINGEWWTPPIGTIIPEQQLTKKVHGLHCFGAASKVFKQKSVNHLNNRFKNFNLLYNNLHDLQLLSENGIDCSKMFCRTDLGKFGYETKTVAEINKICNKQIFKKNKIGADGKVSNFCDKNVVTILNAMLSHIGYKVEHSSKRVRVGGGKQIHVYSYQIVPNDDDDDKSHILLNRKIFKNVIL